MFSVWLSLASAFILALLAVYSVIYYYATAWLFIVGAALSGGFALWELLKTKGYSKQSRWWCSVSLCAVTVLAGYLLLRLVPLSPSAIEPEERILGWLGNARGIEKFMKVDQPPSSKEQFHFNISSKNFTGSIIKYKGYDRLSIQSFVIINFTSAPDIAAMSTAQQDQLLREVKLELLKKGNVQYAIDKKSDGQGFRFTLIRDIPLDSLTEYKLFDEIFSLSGASEMVLTVIDSKFIQVVSDKNKKGS